MLALTQSIVDQMPVITPARKKRIVGRAFQPDSEPCQAGKRELLTCRGNIWQSVYTWLRETNEHVRLVVSDIAGGIVFFGDIEVRVGHRSLFFSFKDDIVTVIVHVSSPVDMEKIELYSPDCFDRISGLIGRAERAEWGDVDKPC